MRVGRRQPGLPWIAVALAATLFLNGLWVGLALGFGPQPAGAVDAATRLAQAEPGYGVLCLHDADDAGSPHRSGHDFLPACCTIGCPMFAPAAMPPAAPPSALVRHGFAFVARWSVSPTPGVTPRLFAKQPRAPPVAA
ncbi:hypothetical protein SAMN02745172_02168 [Pseudoxanthobacter soli DSM 19599]|uniref:DUF2946 domain-containing protein n=1 Tax=Pseudoxanthobacter soli DSM 19599 TaxID=1123029 RepID=A0A1M7ZKU1_9HYPH|nr:hypothetical protein [Pseudoxanthobacter soli]SHO65523.1 hypothetical protein SAMN02745172_02168 [Pseudoxanthobacter soli DSM 19599]